MRGKKSCNWLLLFIAFALLVGGCATTSLKYSIKDEPVYAEAKGDKGLIYMLRPPWRAGILAIEVYINEKVVGVTKGQTYFFCYLDPGDYIIKSKAGQNVQELTLHVEKGKVYYVKQDFTFVGLITLEIIKPEEGQAEIKKLKYIETVLP
jgi:hypothetical protein